MRRKFASGWPKVRAVAAPENLGARRAALLIQGLPAGTRSRVLARLSPGEALRLAPLLDELERIGATAALSTELQRHSNALGAVPRGAGARERAASLHGADVARALADCAPATIATLLRIAEWPWKQAMLERCAELRRAEIHQHLRNERPAPSPALAEALCARLCREAGAPWTR